MPGVRDLKWLLPFTLGLALAGCGGDGADDGPPGETTAAPSADAIEVESTVLDISGGYYSVGVLIRNNSDQVALDVGGQISLVSPSGEVIASTDHDTMNLLPGHRGVLNDGDDAPPGARQAKVETDIVVGEFRPGPAELPVQFVNVRAERDQFGSCEVKGTVSNSFGAYKENLQLQAAVIRDGKLLAHGFAYVDKVFPGRDATFEIGLDSAQECPRRSDEIEILPNLGEDKIFNPEGPEQ